MTIETTQASILIVDDNELNVTLLKSFLGRFNFRILSALNGRDAINMLENTAVDLILLDIMMPEMDGFQVCKIVKANENIKDIPIIFLTAKTETEDIIEAFNCGGIDYLTKPFCKEELIARINTHLEIFFSRKKIITQNEELEKVIRLRDKIYSVIAHDLRAPLSNLKMLSNVMNANSDKIIDEELIEVVMMMDKTIDESFNFLDNLLKWTRQQSGRIVVNNINFESNNLIYDCILHLKMAADQKSLKLFFADQELTHIVHGDQDIFKTILRNLISNAIKFSHENGNIVISQVAKGENLIISVTDTGTGIAIEDQSKILNEKEHFTSYGTNHEKGSGIGLLLSRNLARQMHGDLWFESTPGKGSTFFLSIPLEKRG